MNKRQAKKAFKKRYGCSPNQAVAFFEQLPEIIEIVIDAVNGVVENVVDRINEVINDGT